MAPEATQEKPITNGAIEQDTPQDGDQEKAAAKKEDSKDSSKKDDKKEDDKKEDKQPPGGFDDTPVPHAPPGYTVKFTFHKATNLPMADVNSLSSDPFILAQLNTGLATRHKGDPPLRVRSNTIRRSVNPEWNFEWVVANVPASGFKLKVRVYDEDPADHDDRLGNVHVNVPQLSETWEGIHEQSYNLKIRMGSKRAYAVRGLAVCFGKAKHMRAQLYISAQVLGKTPGEDGGRCFTIGPNWWTKHYSPVLGRIAGRKETVEDRKEDDAPKQDQAKPTKSSKYNFQANQMQLTGPVPAKLYHRYVEFRPIIKYGFTKSGILGFLFNKALHHQHARVYNFDSSTEYGTFEEPGQEITRKFLDLVHYDRGGRIFTYVLTLDALWRFTETGKEFGIDLLSKHTMHSDVSIYTAFSGEFFVRRLEHKHQDPPEEGGHNKSHPPQEISGGPLNGDPPKDPRYFELVIDNDSGTYRPNAETLPLLKKFLEENLPGLHIVTLDCQKDADKMSQMKQEQRDRKEKEGGRIIYTQLSRSSSESSSDEEALNNMEQSGGYQQKRMMNMLSGDAKRKQASRNEHFKNKYAGRPDKHPDAEAGESSAVRPTPVTGERQVEV